MWWLGLILLVGIIAFIIFICIGSGLEKDGFVFRKHKEKDLDKIYDMNNRISYQSAKHKKK